MSNHPTRNQLRLQNLIFIVLFLGIIGVAAWLSTRYHLESDWTANNRNTLSDASIALLQQLDKPVAITAFIREGDIRRNTIKEMIGRYQHTKPDIKLDFINPDVDPDQVRQQGITVEGELVVSYQQKRENIKQLSEEALTNTLQRLARAGERWLVFLNGHGERNPEGEANFDLGAWGNTLQQKGFKLHQVNLTNTPELPINTAVLVLADPQTTLLPGEVKIIKDYLDIGGNLLWLMDPGPQNGLSPIAELLGIQPQPGIIVDPTTQMLGIDDPRFALVSDYPAHPITKEQTNVTLFPQAGGILINNESGWQNTTLLNSMPRSWLETSEIIDHVSYDENEDQVGPIPFGIAQQRDQIDHQQRVVVVADGDFLSNTYVGNGGNLDLGLAMINWLSHDDHLISIPAKSSEDRHLEFTIADQGIIGFGFFIIIPGGLLIAGILIWLRRKKR